MVMMNDSAMRDLTLGTWAAGVWEKELRGVPLVFQEGATLHCTMGNWDGEPTGYTYAWHTGGVANGQTGAEHAVEPEDVGQDWACVVTATNKLGSTVAPMSNSVTVAEAPPA